MTVGSVGVSTECVDEAVAVLRAHGRDDFAAAVRSQADSRRPLRIIVVGETKRGKSALTNTLVGVPGLSPVGVEETSATFVSIASLPVGEDEPWAEVIGTAGARVRIPLAEVPQHADLRYLPEGQEPPLAVEIHLPRGPLGDLGIIDSPGVGGTGSARSRLNERCAAKGGVLVYVVDAGSPMAGTEREFLLRCAARLEHVVVVVTMTDKYPATWQSIVGGLGTRLAAASEHLREVPVIGVSTVMFESARNLAPGDLRDELIRDSGIPRLLGTLAGIIADRDRIPRDNALRTARSGLEQIVFELERAQLLTNRAYAARLEEEVAVLKARREEIASTRGRWALDLDRDLSRLRTEVLRAARTAFDELETDARLRIDKTPLGPRRKDYVRALTIEMVSEYALIRDGLVDMLDDGVKEIVTRMFGDAVLLDDIAGRVAAGTSAAPGGGAVRRPTDLFDPMVVSSLAIGASMAERLTMAVTDSPSSSIVGPVSLAGAGAWVAFNLAFRGNRVERSRLSGELRSSLARQRVEFGEYVDGWLREIKPEVAVAFRSHLDAQLAVVTDAARRIREAREGTEEQRRAQAEARSTAREELRAAIASVDAAIAGGRP